MTNTMNTAKSIRRDGHFSVLLSDGFTITGNYPTIDAAQEAANRLNALASEQRAISSRHGETIAQRRAEIAAAIKPHGLPRSCAKTITGMALSLMEDNEQIASDAVRNAIYLYNSAI
jgi:endonuclease III